MTKPNRFFKSELWYRSMRVLLLWAAMLSIGTMVQFQIRWIHKDDTIGQFGTLVIFGGQALMLLALRELLTYSRATPPPQ